MKRVVGLLLALACTGANISSAQFVWSKDLANPVFNGGGNGAWDKHVFGPMVLYNSDSARYEMWYTGSYGPEISWRPYRIGLAYSNNGVTWTRYSGNPVLSPTAGTWDESSIEAAAVIRENGQYKMWYTGVLGTVAQIGYARSPDGIHWNKDTTNPVLRPGAASWEAGGVAYCQILSSVGGYTALYTGFASSTVSKIGRATSTDGINWQRDTLNNPVLGPGLAGQWDDQAVFVSSVLNMNNVYYLWYTGWRSGGNPQMVGLATSTNGGINWTRHVLNPVLIPGTAGSWDANYAEGGSVVLRGTTLHMWYAGSRENTATNLWRIGHAIDSPTAYVLPNPLVLNFRNTPVGQQFDTLTVKIHNYGRQSAQITGLSVGSSNFQIWNRPTLPHTLDSNRAFDLRIIFRPQVLGTLRDTLVITTNAANTPRHVVELNGNAITGVDDEPSSLPSRFALYQNYPNPFNPITEIRYQTPEVSHVTLKVFDMLGREVATLVNEVQEPEYKSVQWDALGIASGVYFYRLQAGDYIAARRLVLLR